MSRTVIEEEDGVYVIDDACNLVVTRDRLNSALNIDLLDSEGCLIEKILLPGAGAGPAPGSSLPIPLRFGVYYKEIDKNER